MFYVFIVCDTMGKKEEEKPVLISQKRNDVSGIVEMQRDQTF